MGVVAGGSHLPCRHRCEGTVVGQGASSVSIPWPRCPLRPAKAGCGAGRHPGCPEHDRAMGRVPEHHGPVTGWGHGCPSLPSGASPGSRMQAREQLLRALAATSAKNPARDPVSGASHRRRRTKSPFTGPGMRKLGRKLGRGTAGVPQTERPLCNGHHPAASPRPPRPHHLGSPSAMGSAAAAAPLGVRLWGAGVAGTR